MIFGDNTVTYPFPPKSVAYYLNGPLLFFFQTGFLFCRYVNHRKKYPHKMATITLPEMELLLANYGKISSKDAGAATLLNYHL
jgi:hypothetical protein